MGNESSFSTNLTAEKSGGTLVIWGSEIKLHTQNFKNK
jgi:hypothetical protein